MKGSGHGLARLQSRGCNFLLRCSERVTYAERPFVLQEDEADEEDDTETPHSMAGGTPKAPPVGNGRSGRPSTDTPTNTPNNTPELPLGRSPPLRPTTSNTVAFDGDSGDIGRSARMKVQILFRHKSCPRTGSAWGSLGLFRNLTGRLSLCLAQDWVL